MSIYISFFYQINQNIYIDGIIFLYTGNMT